jgi:hypothetical protein
VGIDRRPQVRANHTSTRARIESITLLVRATCGAKTTETPVRIAFDDRGRIDLEAGDLNGNDVPDGLEKKKSG